MFRNKAKLKGIIGIFLLIIVCAGIFFWENWGRQQFDYTEVIVFTKDVSENVIVTKDMLGILSLESSTLIDNPVTNPNDIIGLETNSFIPSKSPLSIKYFSEPELTTGKDKYTFKLPEEWIYSFPQTIRRGDEVLFYLVDAPEDEDRYVAANEGEVAPPKGTYNLAKPLVSAKVAYVKDSSNREVINTGSERYDGSASATQIEIIVTEEIYNQLATAFCDGYVFNLLYE